MRRRPPLSTRAGTLFPYTTRVLSQLPPRLRGQPMGLLRHLHGYRGARPATGLCDLLGGRARHAARGAAAISAADRRAAAGARLRLHPGLLVGRSEEHTSELQSLMRTSYAVFCLKKKRLDV